MGVPVLQYLRNGEGRPAMSLKVPRNRVDEILDVLRCAEGAEVCGHRPRQPPLHATSDFCVDHICYARASSKRSSKRLCIELARVNGVSVYSHPSCMCNRPDSIMGGVTCVLGRSFIHRTGRYRSGFGQHQPYNAGTVHETALRVYP